MCSEVLRNLEKNNQFPIIFVGAGISKRYLEDYPSWIELLEELWYTTNPEGDFYGHLLQNKNLIMNKHRENNEEIDENTLEHEVNTIVASKIEKEINNAFINGNLKISGLTTKEVYNNNISPFKKIIADRFSKVKIKDSMREEYEEFKKMIFNAQAILTTNYDPFIEESYSSINNNELNVYIGEKGLFGQTTGYAELYKIHGCYSDINSIIITVEDYDSFNKASVLISAKIISLLLNSPIIFLGYSLKDVNIKKIIKDFAGSLSTNELMTLERNLIIVDWKKDENNIIESVENSQELGCRYRIITTDNYTQIYQTIANIKQGVPPIEVRKYMHVIKKLIVEKGASGELKSVLINNENLDDIIQNGFKDKNLVVAIGDKQLVFVIPTLATYIRDYINEEFKQDIDNQLRFIAFQQGRIPIKRYVNDENIEKSNLGSHEKDKLRKLLNNYPTVKRLIQGLNCNYSKTSSIKEIVEKSNSKTYEYRWIVYNSEMIPLSDLKKYILEEIEACIKNRINPHSELRKLSVIYDLMKNKKLIKIKS